MEITIEELTKLIRERDVYKQAVELLLSYVERSPEFSGRQETLRKIRKQLDLAKDV